MRDSDICTNLQQARINLAGWTEPDGALVPTEPDVETRARIRISLRGFISGLLVALGERPPAEFEADDHRDLQRIRDAAIAGERAAAVCPGCHAVGPEPHAADCMDEKRRMDEEDRRMRGELYDPTDDLGDDHG